MLIATKLGMMRLFVENKGICPATLLYVPRCFLLEKNEFRIKVGFGEAKNVSKPLQGYFDKLNMPPCSFIKEFKSDVSVEVGSDMPLFEAGSFVDVKGVSIGKGFAGPMKRHNFGGLRASHGVSVTHRSHGSTGHRQRPSKVFKGKKMAGHLGARSVTVQSLEVLLMDLDEKIIAVKGAVPGYRGNIVFVSPACKKRC